MWGLSFGRSATTTESTLTTLQLTQNLHRVGALPLRIVGGEVLADIAEAQGAQQGIHDRVHQHVGIAVAIKAQAIGMVELLTAQDQRPAGH